LLASVEIQDKSFKGLRHLWLVSDEIAQLQAATLRLRELFDIYVREVTPQKGESAQAHDRRCAEMFFRFFPPSRAASTLNRRGRDRFVRERRSGACGPRGVATGSRVGERVIAYDLKWLLAVLNRATRSSTDDGVVLLDRNPLKGLVTLQILRLDGR
jgi:hypothetical protein